MKDIETMLKNLDANKLQQNLKGLNEVLNKNEMKKLKYMISNIHSPAVKKELAKIDEKAIAERMKKNPELFEKLKNLNN